MPISFDRLDTGYEFPVTSCDLNTEFVSRYKEAVGGGKEQDSPLSDFVPPLAIVARAMTELSKSLELPPGSIHASQELEFFRPVSIGAAVSCHSRVVQKVNRGRLRMMAIELNAIDREGERVLSGKATLILPG